MANTGPEGHDQASKLTRLARAEYTCPVCNVVVVRVVGNTLEYLPSHVHAADSAGKDGFVPLVMHHPPKATNFVWPIDLVNPFLAIQSSEMRS
jgi:hypothetical protein